MRAQKVLSKKTILFSYREFGEHLLSEGLEILLLLRVVLEVAGEHAAIDMHYEPSPGHEKKEGALTLQFLNLAICIQRGFPQGWISSAHVPVLRNHFETLWNGVIKGLLRILLHPPAELLVIRVTGLHRSLVQRVVACIFFRRWVRIYCRLSTRLARDCFL